MKSVGICRSGFITIILGSARMQNRNNKGSTTNVLYKHNIMTPGVERAIAEWQDCECHALQL